MRGCFVTGTDTGVGKTVVAGAIVAELRARGIAVRALKPVITGLDEPARPEWPHDHELLARAAGAAPEAVSPIRYRVPASPHLAAALEHRPLELEALLASVREARSGPAAAVIEGVGGLLVPLTDGFDVRALAQAAGLPLVIAARPGLGTINHTLLTLEAARASELEVAGVVLTPWPEAPSAIERSNRTTIERLGSAPVATLPYIRRADPRLLAAAGRLLPLDAWLRLP